METNTNLSQTTCNALVSTAAQAVYVELKASGYPLLISKKQYAEIVNCSVSTVDNYIKGSYGIPNYKKMGNAKNAKVLFSLIDVANFLAQTVKTA